MNATVARALLLDAFHQVVDNKIFRLLLLFDVFVVLASFLIGFRETQVEVLFGAWTLTYEDLFGFFGGKVPAGVDVQGKAIQAFQALLVEGLCGSLGMTVCLAATAFFVPRLLEKGAADIVFAKPVSRWALLLSRYVAGLLFVGLLSVVLIVGLWLGILVASGYNDPGFLWAIATLMYLFAMLHAFSLAVGVFTRSTVAALLISVVFFFLTGCVHRGWKGIEYVRDLRDTEKMRLEVEAKPVELPSPGERTAAESEASSNREEHETSPVLNLIGDAIATAHYVLPKTSDADDLTAKLRKALASENEALHDSIAHVSITPTQETLKRLAPPPGVTEIDLSTAAAEWVEQDSAGKELARFSVSRRSRELPPAGESKRPRRLSTSQAADDVVKRLKQPPNAVRTEKTTVDGSYALAVRWEEGETWHSVHVLTFGDSVIEIASSVPSTSGPARVPGFEDARVSGFLNGVKLAHQTDRLDPDEWYQKRFRVDAPLRFNVLFSIGSTLVFTLLMLLLAWWKLRRIDF